MAKEYKAKGGNGYRKRLANRSWPTKFGRSGVEQLNYQNPKSGKSLVLMAKAESQKSLDSWTKEEWGTKSGKNSTQGKGATGERYLPKKARESLTDEEYNRSTAKKRAAIRKGKQFSKQPDDVAKKSARHRR